MSDCLEFILAILVVIATYALYLGALFAFIWAVWNYIIAPSLPMILGAI